MSKGKQHHLYDNIEAVRKNINPRKGTEISGKMSVGEEYQVVKRGREYHGCGEEYNMEERVRGTNIIFIIILRLLGRISSEEKDGNFGEKCQD